MEDILKDLAAPNTVDNRLTDTLKPIDNPFNNLPQAKVNYTLEAGDNPYSVSEKFNVSKSYIEDKMQTSLNKQGDRLTEILAGGFPTDIYSLPKFVKQQEAISGSDMHLSTHKPSKNSGFTIGFGYDTKEKSIKDIEKDFKEVGIPTNYARLLKQGKKIKINPKQADKLGAVSWRDNYSKGISIGLPLNDLDTRSRDIAISLLYRGDIVKGGSNYSGKLYEYVMNNDIEGALNYIKTAPIKKDENDKIGVPKSLKDRWEKVKI